MTVPGATSTYRHVADGSLVTVANREASARLRNPRTLAFFVVFGLLLGIGMSLFANAASVPSYLGRVLLIGVVWGLAWILVVAVVIVVLVLPPARIANRRLVARLFSDGCVTEVELGPDSLVIRRPAGTRSVPYRAIFRVRAYGSFLRVERRGRLVAELLPLGLLPEDAIEFMRIRSRGRWPATAPLEQGNPDREMVVPAGWSAHVAAVVTRAALHSAAFWVRFALLLLVSVLLAVVAGPGWLFLGPAMAFLSAALTYSGTRRAVASVLPTGSVASTEFLEGRFLSRNAGGVREIRFSDISSLDVRGDVVLLGLGSGPIAIARSLIPDDQIERLTP